MSGQGPAVILVDGAMCYRASGPAGPLAERWPRHYTVYIYDRRGRGESGDTQPYSVEREVEDLDALLRAAGGTAYLYGISSGAVLALEAAARLDGLRKLAVFEPPFIVDDTHPGRGPDDYLDRMDALIAEDRRGDAVKLFMRTVGVPGFGIAMMRLMPVWKKLTGSRTRCRTTSECSATPVRGRPLPTDRWASAKLPTLVMDGGKSPAYMRNSARQLAEILPDASYRTLPGQTHLLKPDAVAPVLKEFFTD